MKIYSLVLVLVFGLALAGCHWGLYSATSQIQIRPRFVVNLGQLSPDGGQAPDAKPFAAQIKAEIQNDDFLRLVIQQLNLGKIWAQRFKSDHAVLTDKESLDHLHTVLNIEGVTGANIIKITAFSEVPQESADMANAVADRYKLMRDAEEARRAQRVLDSLRKQIVQEQDVVENAKYVAANANNDTQREVGQSATVEAQNILDALNLRLRQVIADGKIMESPVRILTRAVAPAE